MTTQPRTASVLVVEDEPPILNHVVGKIKALELPLDVIGTAANGEEAIAFIKQSPPQIVITDIRMPGMDGLTLCKYLHENHPSIKILVLSGYGEFEYARAAIQYNVSDYLLKPINPQKLREALEKILQDVRSSRQQLQRQQLVRQLAGTGGEVPYQFEDVTFGLYLLCLGNLLDRGGSEVPIQYNDLWNNLSLDTLMDAEPVQHWWLIGEKNPNERMLLTAGMVPGLAQRLYDHLSAHAGVSVTICESGTPTTYDDIWATAREMRSTLHRLLTPCTGKLISRQTTFPDFPASFLQRLTAAVQGQASDFHSTLHAYMQELKKRNIPQQSLESTLYNILRIMDQQYPGNEIHRLYHTCCQEIATATDAEILYRKLEKDLMNVFEQAQQEGVSSEDLAVSVKEYIDRHFNEEITMETLAERFHFSESYIARLFRTAYGMPPVKYLLWQRMEKAKELIASHPEMGFGTVAQLVGYGDQHYFSRLFRISTGMSPSAYKASVKDLK